MKTQPKAEQPKPPEPKPPDELDVASLATYEVVKLLQLWHRSQLTTEQMIGHILQHLFAQQKRLTALERGAPSAVNQ